MKLSHVLPLAALGTALVLPPEEVLGNIAIDGQPRTNIWNEKATQHKHDVISNFGKHYEEVTDAAKNAWTQLYEGWESVLDDALDEALDRAAETGQVANEKTHESAFDVDSWLSSEADELFDSSTEHGDPNHKPGRWAHHPGHHGKPNQTVYQLISESKYTTNFSKLINKYDDLVDLLNSTEANYTVFVPTDKAFAKLPKHIPEPSKEHLKAILSYHVVDGFYPAGRVFASHTAPTLFEGAHLASKPQRVAFKFSLRGLTVNLYSRIIAINIFGTNGVIHGVDSIIIPPPSAVKIIGLFPSEFSTLELGLTKTGLLEELSTTDHAGGTLFAPSNRAFTKLGPKINAFLFSKYGLKYLKALLEYHVVPDHTLYSDAYYNTTSSDVEEQDVAKGVFHVDLPTLLKSHSVGVDIARFGGFITLKINGFSRVTLQDGIADDGVIHVVSDVIVPPRKKKGGRDSDEVQYWSGEEMSVEEFIERLEPFVPKSDL